jgi:hypothetical protein
MSGQIGSWKVRLALEEKHLQGYKSIMLIRPDQCHSSDEFWLNNEYGVVSDARLDDEL